MGLTRVFFNRGLSNTFDALQIIKAADHTRRFNLRATHVDAHAPVLTVADDHAVEPRDLDEDAYVAWCLDQCRTHAVDLFVPQRRRGAIARRRGDFEALGVAVSVMGDPMVMDMVEHKQALYADLAGTGVPLPPYRVFETLDAFDAAVAALEPTAEHLCVKPCVGVYGAGFRILERRGRDFAWMVADDTPRVSMTAFRMALAGSEQNRDMMLMAYLPGRERSVDVLAHKGRVARAVARVKHGGHQVLELDGPSVDMAAFLTERYALDGLFNFQTKEWNGEPHLLEINSRMSGGLLYACMAGVALPYWNLMLTAGFATPEDLPAPIEGVRVAPIQGCVAV
jgi:hypothetical protein